MTAEEAVRTIRDKSDLFLTALHEERRLMIEYLNHKVRTQDWHGVADAAMDIREIDAKIAVLKLLSL